MATHAVGFRVYNDAALIIAALRQAEVRKVAHVDVDANHDNGVQTAFEATQVLTESIHQSPMSLFHPYTRAANRIGVLFAVLQLARLSIIGGHSTSTSFPRYANWRCRRQGS